MSPSPILSRARLLLCAPLLLLGLAGCASTVSTSAYKGAEHEVAQTIANLQTDATALNEKKVCTEDLASTVVTRLGGISACEAALKDQLGEIDSYELSVSSVSVDEAAGTATAEVKSVQAGKSRKATLQLVKEGKSWKISGL